jgi:hypothetical protein
MDAVYQAGWDIAQGSWRVGAVNANTGQYAKGYENNIKLIRGVGLSLTVPGKEEW